MTKPLHTVALIADTHINPVDGESGSPWRSNAMANDRARWAVAALNADAPEAVFHLGDMVHPLPAQASYGAAAARFRAIFSGLDAPLHLVPGNHDIGDKPGDWMPAHPVVAGGLTTYAKAFGALWQVVDHGCCRFILHGNPILGSGLPEDAAQWAWLEHQLTQADGKRVFFLTHYPLFLTTRDEPEHYDNLAWAARERLRGLLVQHRVEAVFAAHVHTIFHTPLADTATAPMQHVLPSVSALRLDYSYLFRTPPPEEQEFGRNDAQKLGYYLLDILPEGYRIRLRRSDGQTLEDGQTDQRPGALMAYQERIADRAIGVDMRHGWAHPHAIPYSGVVDEFRRKYVHNDYLITALQEAGIRDLRVPIDDLKDTQTRDRLRVLAQFGHRFQVFTIDQPDGDSAAVLQDMPHVSGLEVIARPDRLPQLLGQWRAIVAQSGADLLASRLWSSADIATQEVSFAHGIGHGFFAQDQAMVAAIADQVDGVVLRVGPEAEPAAALRALPQSFAGRVVLYVDMASASPAQTEGDDAAQTRRVIAALLAARACPVPASVMLNTFDDHNRGYYPRHGLYDAQFNPRPVAQRLARFDLRDLT